MQIYEHIYTNLQTRSGENGTTPNFQHYLKVPEIIIWFFFTRTSPGILNTHIYASFSIETYTDCLVCCLVFFIIMRRRARHLRQLLGKLLSLFGCRKVFVESIRRSRCWRDYERIENGESWRVKWVPPSPPITNSPAVQRSPGRDFGGIS